MSRFTTTYRMILRPTGYSVEKSMKKLRAHQTIGFIYLEQRAALLSQSFLPQS